MLQQQRKSSIPMSGRTNAGGYSQSLGQQAAPAPTYGNPGQRAQVPAPPITPAPIGQTRIAPVSPYMPQRQTITDPGMVMMGAAPRPQMPSYGAQPQRVRMGGGVMAYEPPTSRFSPAQLMAAFGAQGQSRLVNPATQPTGGISPQNLDFLKQYMQPGYAAGGIRAL